MKLIKVFGSSYILCLSWSLSAVAEQSPNLPASLQGFHTTTACLIQEPCINNYFKISQNINFEIDYPKYTLIVQKPPTEPLIVPPGVLDPTLPVLPPLPKISPTTPTPLLPLTPPPVTSPTSPSELPVKIQIKKIDILGSTIFTTEQLQDKVEEFINKEVTFEELLAIRTAITKLYTDKGYTTSGAFLPPQDLTDGVVKIQVVEGAIEKIAIKGLSHLKTSYIRDRIGLATHPPINLRRIEEALQLLQINPLISSVQANLSAGTAPGLSVLTLNLKEAPVFTYAIQVDNNESASVGEIKGTALVAHQNLLGIGDRFSAEYSATAGIDRYSVRYEVPLNPHDGTLSVRFEKSHNEIVEARFVELGINSDAETFSIGLRQPLIRNLTSEFALGFAVDLRQSRTFIYKDTPFSFSLGTENGKSRVTVLRFNQDWVERSTNQVLAARSQFSLGLDAFDATVNDSGTDGRFFSWTGQFQWIRALAEDTILITRIGMQLSPDSLLPLEQFSIGGVDTVRGFRQNERVADNGIVGSIELRLPVVRDRNGIGIIQFAPFFDIGTAWNHKLEVPSPHTLAGLGLGLVWQYKSMFAASLNWAISLNSINDIGNSLQDNGIYFSLRLSNPD
ncbi:ShlB/FhaC/HecB family hemolysin secretion/activation protein [Calothrix sp. FACHB-156]|nr:ShlB/FhaC/HecB family hemolysin secretion/activation protein [Calothrix sp. FACHB-156]